MGDVVRLTLARPAPVEQRDRRAEPEPLWREAAGAALRERRLADGDRLADVAERAGISTQYLSEVERGVKDPSSEVLAAVAGALGLTTLDLTVDVARRLRSTGASSRPIAPARPTGPVCLAA